ncbi:hypothetical protein VOLCADRAFT_100431 [Volvox carteri f. nagariensis]|uniref:Nucleotide-diphospho-sugar transferase domain-containing protein n=1 Tax=Volvox carteri f. nagariensis TaxID=3068 RepID=D8UK70_VOLCA|nr:uncharacterized protein VOLCADRAFT_100431 [Volvox carteri f. nagariensis]EFJ39875.1 hypothetical protein VOLCADRAFT_100431 [Volvox carteri f. nagariensis]|eukprot:XP_002959052.1 hypothetical protein VOLCADRAFT_100431 [Volvox carteri f. nagariensis]
MASVYMNFGRVDTTFLARAGGQKEGSWPNISIADISKSFWIHHGPRLPSKEFVEAVKDHLAAHLVAVLMTLPGETPERCSQISRPYGTSFVKTLTLLNALTLGLDVFFLDSDQVFFRNPLPYIVSRDIDVLVTGDCSSRLDTVPQSHFPSNIKTNIGLLYMRSKPLVIRAVINWLQYIVRRAPSERPVLDQTSFSGAMEGVSGEVGEKAMSLALLRSEYFPHWCIAECGCDTEGMDLGQPGWGVRRRGDGTCETELMRRWYNFHVPCTQGMDYKVRNLLELLYMYITRVGPVNSLSEPVDVI